MTITLDAPDKQALDHRVDRFDASEASTERLFGGEGRSISGLARTRRDKKNPRYLADIEAVEDLYESVLAGSRRAALDFVENMSTSDFSNLFGDVLDRQILAHYATAPINWGAWAKKGRVRDFRTVKRFTIDGGNGVLPKVKQYAPYPAAKFDDGVFSYSVEKYGQRYPLSWETLVNDDLDAFAELPMIMGTSARRSEERFSTALFATSTGPNGTFFSTANKNVINPTVLPNTALTNPPLTVSSLELALQALWQQVDTTGNPVSLDGVSLVVPPALMVAAMNIINAIQIDTATGSGGAVSDEGRPNTLRVNNWLNGGITVIPNQYLQQISTTNGTTSWYLFANPNVGRPAMEMGFLLGHEGPELFVKSPNAMRVGGGSVAPEEGDFDSDAAEWKVRLVMGGTLMDPKSAVASNGTGS